MSRDDVHLVRIESADLGRVDVVPGLPLVDVAVPLHDVSVGGKLRLDPISRVQVSLFAPLAGHESFERCDVLLETVQVQGPDDRLDRQVPQLLLEGLNRHVVDQHRRRFSAAGLAVVVAADRNRVRAGGQGPQLPPERPPVGGTRAGIAVDPFDLGDEVGPSRSQGRPVQREHDLAPLVVVVILGLAQSVRQSNLECLRGRQIEPESPPAGDVVDVRAVDPAQVDLQRPAGQPAGPQMDSRRVRRCAAPAEGVVLIGKPLVAEIEVRVDHDRAEGRCADGDDGETEQASRSFRYDVLPVAENG